MKKVRLPWKAMSDPVPDDLTLDRFLELLSHPVLPKISHMFVEKKYEPADGKDYAIAACAIGDVAYQLDCDELKLCSWLDEQAGNCMLPDPKPIDRGDTIDLSSWVIYKNDFTRATKLTIAKQLRAAIAKHCPDGIIMQEGALSA